MGFFQSLGIHVPCYTYLCLFRFHIKSDILIRNQGFNQTECLARRASAPDRQANVVQPAMLSAKGMGPGICMRLTNSPASAPQEMEIVPIRAEADPS